MGALRRLVQLLRVAQQHQIRPRMGDGQHVGERHLRGLVDEEDVDATLRFGPGPEPGRAGRDLAAAGERSEHRRVGLCHSKTFVIAVCRVGRQAADFLNRPQVDPILLCRCQHAVKQIPDHFVAVGADAHARAVLHQAADHARGRVCFACARRPLDRQQAEAGLARDALRRVRGGLACPPQGLPARARGAGAREGRRAALNGPSARMPLPATCRPTRTRASFCASVRM